MFSTLTKAAAALTGVSARHDVTSDLHDRADKAERTARQFYGHAADYANEAGQTIREFADDTANDLKNAADLATGQFRANPLPAALALLGAGVVIGFLLRGRPA